MKIFLYVRLHLKTIPWKFCIPNPKNYLVIYPQSFRNVCLQTYRNNRIRQKVAYFLRKIQTLWVNNSRILRIKNAKFSGFCFYMNTNVREIFKPALVYLKQMLCYTTIFSEYYRLLAPEAAVQNVLCKILLYRKTLVSESFCSKVTGLNYISLH